MKSIQWNIVGAIVIAGAIISSAFVFAQEDVSTRASAGLAGITFPISELGNCTDKESCHAYCDDSAHMGECIAFAEAHGLMNKEEVERGKKFAVQMKSGGGPGGCTSPESCRAFCEDIAHLEECVTFAEKHDFVGEEHKEGKKIQAYLKGGGTMPGGCTSRTMCEEYCGDFTHGEECQRFMVAAGLEDAQSGTRGGQGGGLGKGEHEQMPTPEQFKKLTELAKNGETPGGCKSKNECETYCRADGHFEECIAFGERVGFMNKEDGERARKMITQGGPGGCKSPEACHAFCNNPANQEACFKFAEENELIPKEELSRMKEGMVRMRQGVDSAPENVKECLKSTVGETILNDVQSGAMVPGPELGEKMRACFEKMGGEHDPGRMLSNAPAGVTACLQEKLGDEFERVKSGKQAPTPEMADMFRVCFQTMEMEKDGWGRPDEGMGGGRGVPGSMQQSEGMNRGPNIDMLKRVLGSAPPEVLACVKEKVGDIEQIMSGGVPPPLEIGEKIHTCFDGFRPQMQGGMMPRQGEEGHQGEEGGSKMRPYPPGMGIPIDSRPQGMPGQGGSSMGMPTGISAEVLRCLKEKLGEEAFTSSMRDPRATAETGPAMRACFEQYGNPGTRSGQDGGGVQMMPKVLPESDMMPQGGTMPSQTWVSRLPLSVQECMKQKLGVEYFIRLAFSAPTPDAEAVISACHATSGTQVPMEMPPRMPPSEGELLPPPPLPTMEPQQQTSITKLLLAAAISPILHLRDLMR